MGIRRVRMGRNMAGEARTMQRARWLGALVALAVVAGGARGDGPIRVTMRSTARVVEGSPVTLGDIAGVEGEGAERLRAVVVIDRADGKEGWVEVEGERVRSLLRAQGVREGLLEVSGGSCAVLAMRAAPSLEHPGALTPVVAREAEGDHRGTIRERVEVAIAGALGVAGGDLRLRFDGRDGEVLREMVGDRALVARATGLGDRVPVSLTVYDGDRVVESRTIRVGVEVRREVLVAARDLSRGEALEGQSVLIERRWLAPTVRPAGVRGDPDRVCTRSVRAGRVIEEHEVTMPIVVRRGDLVSIHCVSGSLVVEMQRMRARGDARVGETIEFEAGDRSRVLARVDAPGRAVIMAGHGAGPEQGEGR